MSWLVLFCALNQAVFAAINYPGESTFGLPWWISAMGASFFLGQWCGVPSWGWWRT